jgi:hypothetical protein
MQLLTRMEQEYQELGIAIRVLRRMTAVPKTTAVVAAAQHAAGLGPNDAILAALEAVGKTGATSQHLSEMLKDTVKLTAMGAGQRLKHMARLKLVRVKKQKQGVAIWVAR